jgi:flavin reductase (DIM6/NTAB) family NADH-FMN oxidoreductase RutF
MSTTATNRVPLDQAALRSCLSRFATGVCVVTVDAEDGEHGLTVNAFTAVSLEPTLVLVSIARRARGHDLLRGRPFAVNVLGAEQEPVARHFAGDPHPQYVCWARGEIAPLLVGALAMFECEPWAAYDGGDHTLYVGEVVDFAYRTGDALGYFYSRFATVEEPVLGMEYLL